MDIEKHPKHWHKVIVTFENEKEIECFDNYSYGSGSLRESHRRSFDLWFPPAEYPYKRDVALSVVGHVAFMAANRSKPSHYPSNTAANEILRATTYYLQERYHDIVEQSLPVEQERMPSLPTTDPVGQ